MARSIAILGMIAIIASAAGCKVKSKSDSKALSDSGAGPGAECSEEDLFACSEEQLDAMATSVRAEAVKELEAYTLASWDQEDVLDATPDNMDAAFATDERLALIDARADAIDAAKAIRTVLADAMAAADPADEPVGDVHDGDDPIDVIPSTPADAPDEAQVQAGEDAEPVSDALVKTPTGQLDFDAYLERVAEAKALVKDVKKFYDVAKAGKNFATVLRAGTNPVSAAYALWKASKVVWGFIEDKYGSKKRFTQMFTECLDQMKVNAEAGAFVCSENGQPIRKLRPDYDTWYLRVKDRLRQINRQYDPLAPSNSLDWMVPEFCRLVALEENFTTEPRRFCRERPAAEVEEEEKAEREAAEAVRIPSDDEIKAVVVAKFQFAEEYGVRAGDGVFGYPEGGDCKASCGKWIEAAKAPGEGINEVLRELHASMRTGLEAVCERQCGTTLAERRKEAADQRADQVASVMRWYPSCAELDTGYNDRILHKAACTAEYGGEWSAWRPSDAKNDEDKRLYCHNNPADVKTLLRSGTCKCGTYTEPGSTRLKKLWVTRDMPEGQNCAAALQAKGEAAAP